LWSDEVEEASGRLETRDEDLLHLVVANWLEQFPRMRALHRGAHMNAFKRLQRHLRPQARQDLEAIYGFGGCGVPTELKSSFGMDQETGRALELLLVDGLVPPHLALRLTALMQRNIWRFGWRAATTQTTHHFWHSHFGGDTEDGKTDCQHELENRPLMAPVLELWNLVRDRFCQGHVLVRAYANGHTFGSDGHLHTDSEQPGHFTTIYYAHEIWEANWAGETVFFNSIGDDVLQAVHPRPGRLVHFPGTVPHAARGPSRDCPALRAVIVLKTYAPAVGSDDR
jgi:SM-20-related protein